MPKSKIEVFINVEQDSEVLSNADDRLENPVGSYTYTVMASTEREAIRTALDEFHSSVSIGCLDDFEITAYVES